MRSRTAAGQPGGSDYGSIEGHGNDQEELSVGRTGSFDGGQIRNASVNRRSMFMPNLMRRKNSSAPERPAERPAEPPHVLPYQRERIGDDESTRASIAPQVI
jgi:hypothetical protein